MTPKPYAAAGHRRLALLAAALTATTFGTASIAAQPQSTAAAKAESGAPATSSPSFQKLDTNRDGYLSREETSGLINFGKAFDEADENRDGQLDPDEFVKAQAIHERVRLATYVNDSYITAKVKAALIKDRDVRAHAVNVETYKGVVQLSGFVDTDKHARRAVEIAAGIEGVIDVKNALIVKS